MQLQIAAAIWRVEMRSGSAFSEITLYLLLLLLFFVIVDVGFQLVVGMLL